MHKKISNADCSSHRKASSIGPPTYWLQWAHTYSGKSILRSGVVFKSCGSSLFSVLASVPVWKDELCVSEMTLNLRLVFCSHFLEVFWGRFLLDIQHKNFELSVCVAWTVRVTEIFLYTKVYSFGGNKALLRVKRTFELSEFELSRFYCNHYCNHLCKTIPDKSWFYTT